MELEKLLKGKKVRSLFDRYCSEFNASEIYEKVDVLIQLNKYNLLDEAIDNYKKKYNQDKDKYIIKELKPSLQSYVSYLRNDKFLITRDVENLEFIEVIRQLKNELSKKAENDELNKRHYI